MPALSLSTIEAELKPVLDRSVPIYYDSIMGRPREFDVDEATAKAMQAFWQGGYERTSVSDLMAATGLEKGSIYKAYGRKEDLFLAALDRYLSAGVLQAESIIRTAPSAEHALREILEYIQQYLSGKLGATGCLAVNITIEAVDGPEAIVRRLDRHWTYSRSVYERVIVQGQTEGSFRSDLPASELAEVIMRMVIGTAVLSRQIASTADDLADRVLGLVTTSRSE